jgi:hypothetical protein
MRKLGIVAGLVVAAWWAGSWGGEAKFKVADVVVVRTDKAEVKKGSTVIARLPKGARVKLYAVHERGGFALVYVKVEGDVRQGYVKLRDLEPPRRKGAEVKGTGYVADDRVVVVASSAKLKKGKTVLGRVAKGTVLTVEKVRGEWIGVSADVGGKKTFGWLHSRDVDYAPAEVEGKGEGEAEKPGKKAPKK